MKKIFQIILIICGGLIMNSCYYDEIPEKVVIDSPTDPGDPGYVEIKFGAEIQPIFTESCVSCHDDSRSPDLRKDYSYSALVPEYVKEKDAAASRLYIQLAGGHRSLADDKITLIKTWINQGAKDN